MHVAHLMVGNLPFPHDWADATARIALATKLQFGAEVDFAVGHLGPKPSLRPKRAFYRLNDTNAARRIGSAVQALAEVGPPVEVLHGHFFSAVRPLLRAAQRRALPVVITEHSSGFTGLAAPHKQLSKAAFARAAAVYERSDMVLAVSDYLAECIAERTSFTPRVVPNPIDVDLFGLGPRHLPDRDASCSSVGSKPISGQHCCSRASSA